MFEIKNPKSGSILQVAQYDFHYEMNYHLAKKACEALGDGWRLPTVFEAELLYKELHLKKKGNFEKKGYFQLYGSYWCEKDDHNLSKVFSSYYINSETKNDFDIYTAMNKEKTISEFLSQEYKDFALYTIENRAIPSVIDGFKPTHRKIIHACNSIWKSGTEKPLKVFQLAGKVASDCFYQ